MFEANIDNKPVNGYLPVILDHGYPLNYLAGILSIPYKTLEGIKNGAITSEENLIKIKNFYDSMFLQSIEYSDQEIIESVLPHEQDTVKKLRDQFSMQTNTLAVKAQSHFEALTNLQKAIIEQKIKIIEHLLVNRGIQKKEYMFSSTEKGLNYLNSKLNFLFEKLVESKGTSLLAERNNELRRLRNYFLINAITNKLGPSNIASYLAENFPQVFASEAQATNRIQTLICREKAAQNPTIEEIYALSELKKYFDLILENSGNNYSNIPRQFKIVYKSRILASGIQRVQKMGANLSYFVEAIDAKVSGNALRKKIEYLAQCSLDDYYPNESPFSIDKIDHIINLIRKCDQLENLSIPELANFFLKQNNNNHDVAVYIGLSTLVKKLNAFLESAGCKLDISSIKPKKLMDLYYQHLADILNKELPPDTLWTLDDAWLYEKENPILALVFREIKAINDAGQLKKIFVHLAEDIQNRGYESIEGEPMPKTWGECQAIFRGIPTYQCPHVSCRHHIALEINTSGVRINPYVMMSTGDFVPGAPTCSLQLAQVRGGMTLENVGYVFGMSKQAAHHCIRKVISRHGRKLWRLLRSGRLATLK